MKNLFFFSVIYINFLYAQNDIPVAPGRPDFSDVYEIVEILTAAVMDQAGGNTIVQIMPNEAYYPNMFEDAPTNFVTNWGHELSDLIFGPWLLPNNFVMVDEDTSVPSSVSGVYFPNYTNGVNYIFDGFLVAFQDANLEGNLNTPVFGFGIGEILGSMNGSLISTHPFFSGRLYLYISALGISLSNYSGRVVWAYNYSELIHQIMNQIQNLNYLDASAMCTLGIDETQSQLSDLHRDSDQMPNCDNPFVPDLNLQFRIKFRVKRGHPEILLEWINFETYNKGEFIIYRFFDHRRRLSTIDEFNIDETNNAYEARLGEINTNNKTEQHKIYFSQDHSSFFIFDGIKLITFKKAEKIENPTKISDLFRFYEPISSFNILP
jgi:hypothetical protein